MVIAGRQTKPGVWAAPVLLLFGSAIYAQTAPSEYLPLCAQCLNPRVTIKTGAETTTAMAEARVTAADARAWCAANRPHDPSCAGRRPSYRAGADCPGGRLHSMNGGDFTFAGLWTDGPGRGRPQFHDSGGNLSPWGPDPFTAYSLAGQWEALCGHSAPAAKPAEREWLSVCSRCPSPSVVSKSGIGTANARAEARMTRDDVQGWCEESSPQNVEACIRQELAESRGKIFRAAADCPAGRITTIEDQQYTLAGVWDATDIGAGRTKWRGSDGQIVGRDNASNGLAISQQWELLCPESKKK